MDLAMRRLALVVAVCVLGMAIASKPAPARAVLFPRVESQLLDEAGDPIAGEVDSGEAIHVTATVTGAGAAPTGAVTYQHFAAAGCSGPSTEDAAALLVVTTQQVSKAIDISNGAGWDSATAWNSNGIDYLATNWGDALFAGNDVGFGSSSMAWRFNGVPLRAGDTVTAAHLELRIRKSRPSIAAEEPSTWKTVLAADTRNGSDFAGETRSMFLARFDTWASFWDVPVSPTVVDPFGTDDGAEFAASPDVGYLVQSRIDHPSWAVGGSVAIGVLNHGTPGIAEAYVEDDPDNARLHVEWVTTEETASADSGPLRPRSGAQSYQAQYGGDGVYAAAAGPCMALTVAPPASVGGVAEQPDIRALPAHASGDQRRESALAGLASAVIGGACAWRWRRQRAG
jgi:hypothetical protein